MIFSDGTIRRLLADGEIDIVPISEVQIQPASVDVHLGDEFRLIINHNAELIDPYSATVDLTSMVSVSDGEPFILHPGEFVLATTRETLRLPDYIVARVDGKSSLGRWGLMIHATAGFIDAGFSGELTLELSNVATLPVKLWPGMAIGQISFMPLDVPAQRPYGSPGLNSKYQDQRGPQASRYGENVQSDMQPNIWSPNPKLTAAQDGGLVEELPPRVDQTPVGGFLGAQIGSCDRDHLLKAIASKALVRGALTMSSGGTAECYVDLRKVTLDGGLAPLVGREMLALTRNWTYDAVGGLTLGADPVATAMMCASTGALDAFVVRKAKKCHGLQHRIEGPDVAGRRVLVVEDTCTTGASVLTAVHELRAGGADVVGVAVVVDRGAGPAVMCQGLPYLAVYTLEELLHA